MEKIIIKVLADPATPGLSAKYVNAKEYIPIGTGEDGKPITGLDENTLEILRIEDPIKRKKVQTAIKSEREELERLLGRPLDINADYWENFFVVLEDGLELDPANPMHRLVEKFLIANKKVAPDEETHLIDESFSNCVFYMYRETVQVTKQVEREAEKDKAISNLYAIREANPKKIATLYTYLFGYTGSDVSPDAAYIKIKELINAVDEKAAIKNIQKINDALAMTPEQIGGKLLLDRAIKKKIVTSKRNIYRRGEQVLGNSYDEALEYLLSAENSAELVSLKKEVDKA